MRRINITAYEVEIQDVNGKKTLPYDVKESLQMALYNPGLQLGSRELFDNDRVAQKIKAADEWVMLEEADYMKLKQALETIKGYTKNDLEMLHRVLDAKEE